MSHDDKNGEAWRTEEERALPEFVLASIDLLMRDFAEMPDRTSPEDFPEGYVLTRQEIVRGIVKIIECDRAARPSLAAPEEAFVVEAVAGKYEPSFWMVCAYPNRRQALDEAERMTKAAAEFWKEREPLGYGPGGAGMENAEFDKAFAEFDAKREALMLKWRPLVGDPELHEYDQTRYIVRSVPLRGFAPSPLATTDSEVLAKLQDPTNVCVNIIRGVIAKPSIRALLHIYGEKALAIWDAANGDEQMASERPSHIEPKEPK